MNYDYYLIDVFTDEPFGGVQTAVFAQADAFDDKQMQTLAQEMGSPETAFITSIDKKTNHFKMRVFSPLKEVEFAGQAIVAAGYALAESKQIELVAPYTSVTLDINGGPVDVAISSEDDQATFVQFSRKASAIVDRFAPTDEEIAKLLSLKPADINSSSYSARLASCGHPYLIVSLRKYESVRKARFNYQAWSLSTAPQTAAQEILLFTDKNPHSDAEFNLRLVGPNISIHEDPPVGGSLPAFAAYLCSFDHVREGTQTFAIDRGEPGSRRSLIQIEMDNNKTGEAKIRVGGKSIIVAKGTFSI